MRLKSQGPFILLIYGKANQKNKSIQDVFHFQALVK